MMSLSTSSAAYFFRFVSPAASQSHQNSRISILR